MSYDIVKKIVDETFDLANPKAWREIQRLLILEIPKKKAFKVMSIVWAARKNKKGRGMPFPESELRAQWEAVVNE